jgi:integrase/recombinase XerD
MITAARCTTKWSAKRFCMLKRTLASPKKKVLGSQPALHALRHSFAVARLLAWYRVGGNVRTQLPNLSVYMGHLGMLETYHYLSATPELLTIAGEMFDRYAETGGPL